MKAKKSQCNPNVADWIIKELENALTSNSKVRKMGNKKYNLIERNIIDLENEINTLSFWLKYTTGFLLFIIGLIFGYIIGIK